MRGKALHKLRSQAGASLSMALLLMLVCVTVSTVMISAATATAGRFAAAPASGTHTGRLQDVDQSYYNVTSAAGLFWDRLQEGVTVQVERTCTMCLVDGTWKADETSATYSIAGRFDASNLTSSTLGASVFDIATCDAVFGTGGNVADERNVDGDDIVNSIDTATNLPCPLHAFGTYEVTVGPWSAGGQTMSEVVATIQGSENGIVTIRFEEKPDPSTEQTAPLCRCVLTAELTSGVDAPTDTENPDGSHTYTWTTDYEWRPVSMSVEDLS